ncbi:hypothetical protein [Marinobacter xiaoshiensis]|uniref:Uncharacterized protein n=1 Tax=Marinobacter xiaoshiensis TaxID=3073652 RepID=A0ABU2HCS5_9GAMM|nr:hypothetical protein [Marinobacter sp. F60267]MDS1308883.1 hypothetical protein [Marinobacter sp. F60267]
MKKELQTSKSVLDEGIDRTHRLNIPIPNPDTVTPEDVIRYRVLVAQAWIEQDIKFNFLPDDIPDFATIGDYCDHNMYLLDEALQGSKVGSFYEWDWDVQKICDHFNAVADALSKWLESGRKGSAADYIDIEASFS